MEISNLNGVVIYHLDIPVTLPTKDQYVRNYPWRSPLVVAEAAKPHLTDRVLCDLGCGEGDLLVQFTKYAKQAFGVELIHDRFAKSKNRGIDTRLHNWQQQFPEADIYFLWPNDRRHYMQVAELCTQRNKPMLFGGRKDFPTVLEVAEKYNGFIYEFPFHEIAELREWPNEGFWWLGVINDEPKL